MAILETLAQRLRHYRECSKMIERYVDDSGQRQPGLSMTPTTPIPLELRVYEAAEQALAMRASSRG